MTGDITGCDEVLVLEVAFDFADAELCRVELVELAKRLANDFGFVGLDTALPGWSCRGTTVLKKSA